MRTFAVGALLLTACAPHPPLSDKLEQGKCSTVGLDDLVGKPATVGLANDARKRSGSHVARAIGPGQIVTMDYRADRLNIYLDAKGVVVRFSCG